MLFFQLAFLLSFTAVTYVMAGYPLLLKVLARYRSRPVTKGAVPRSVSILIPVRNGGAFIRDKLMSVLGQDYPKELVEIIVLSDESTDETDDVVREFAAAGVELVRLPRGGKPAALNAGFRRAHNEILVLTDVRQTLDRGCVKALVSCFADERVGVVSGELLIRSGELSEQADIGLYWRFETWIRRELARLDSMFGATGPIYAIRRSLAVDFPPEILLDDMYLPLTAFFRGYRLIVEESARAFDHPAKLGGEFRRKLRTLAGNYQILQYMPQLLGPRNRMWLHFVSYKVGRLLLPYILLALAVSSLLAGSVWGRLVFTGMIAFAILAALDGWIPQKQSIKRVSSAARTFTVMMLATAGAVCVFFVSPQRLWTQSTITPAVNDRLEPAKTSEDVGRTQSV